MRRTQKILSVILAIMMILSVIPITASATTYSGTCGENITWVFDNSSGTLTVSGTGAIPDFWDEDNYIARPWEDIIGQSVKHIVINEGITEIGDDSFYGAKALETVTMYSVMYIGERAFSNAESLKSIAMSNSIRVIQDAVFYKCENLIYIYYSGTQDEWENFYVSDKLNDEFFTAKVYTSDYSVSSDNGTYKGFIGGDVVSWDFDANTSTLTISGKGKIADELSGTYDDVKYKYVGKFRPWENYKFDIKKVVVSDEITYIGGNVFRFFLNLTEVVIPNSVTKIANNAFKSSDGITDVYYSGTEEQWKSIVVGTNNESLLNANIHYNYVGCEHNFDSFIVTEPTCQNRGYTTYICSICKDSYVDDYVDAACRYDAVITSPTCTKQGYTTYTCPVCENSYIDDYVDATGHGEYIVSSTLSPTCTKKGYTQYMCSNGCGDNYVKATEPALGHSYVDTKIIEPTCTADGIKNLECSVCGGTTTQTLPAMGHNYLSEITVPATHIATGLMTFTCACGDSYTETIDKLAEHNHNAVVTAPTCTEQGYTTYTCECGDSYVDDYVDELGHTEETIPVVAPSCTETGLTEGAKCSVCGETLTEQKELSANGHTPTNAVEENYITPTCTSNGSVDKVVYCLECNEEISRETETIEATGHADNNGDGYCDADNELLDPTVECNHNCHKSGITGFIWKIINFFNKLFGLNKLCECGVAHY